MDAKLLDAYTKLRSALRESIITPRADILKALAKALRVDKIAVGPDSRTNKFFLVREGAPLGRGALFEVTPTVSLKRDTITVALLVSERRGSRTAKLPKAYTISLADLITSGRLLSKVSDLKVVSSTASSGTAMDIELDFVAQKARASHNLRGMLEVRYTYYSGELGLVGKLTTKLK